MTNQRRCNATNKNGKRCARPATAKLSYLGNEHENNFGPCKVHVHVCTEHTPTGVLVEPPEQEGCMRIRL